VSQSFAGSGVTLHAATAVEAYISANAGAKQYGGIRRPYAQTQINNFVAGVSPTSYSFLYSAGFEPTATGATYPASNVNLVPNTFLADFPDYTSPETMITSGPWAGYMVAELLDDWMISEFYS
jgi:hypothetical protein